MKHGFKHAKRPTRKQKIFLKQKKLDVANWMVFNDTSEVLEIVNRNSGSIRKFQKEG